MPPWRSRWDEAGVPGVDLSSKVLSAPDHGVVKHRQQLVAAGTSTGPGPHLGSAVGQVFRSATGEGKGPEGESQQAQEHRARDGHPGHG